jgi:hypothetical protein
MTGTNNEFSDWFCLSKGRKNFQIDPNKDSEFLFGNPRDDEEIKSMLLRSQVLALPMRLVWWGQYGIGKTHRLRHTERIINENGYRFEPHYVLCGDINEKTGFERLHYQLVSVLDRETIRTLVTSYILKLRTNTEGYVPLKDLCGTSADVMGALKAFGSDNEMLVKPSWNYLCGLPLDKGDVNSAGVTKPKLELTSDYAAVFNALATIIEKETGKQLFYLIDEGEKLTRIINKTAEASWNETLRAILDIQNLNIAITIGAEKLDQLPKLLMFPDIVRRIQKANYIQMEALKEAVAVNFVKDLLGKWIDPDLCRSVANTENFTNKYQGFKLEYYPFADEGAFQMFIDNAIIDMRDAKPAVILFKLNTVAAEALFKERRLITKEHLTELGYA